MQDILFRFVFVALFSFAISLGQQQDKPRIANITVLPSEPIVPSGTCKSSTAGYLDDSRPPKMMSDEDLGKFVSKSLRDGYIVSIYPSTKTGIFVTMQCTNTMASAIP
jgi:hypothetical protein